MLYRAFWGFCLRKEQVVRVKIEFAWHSENKKNFIQINIKGAIKKKFLT